MDNGLASSLRALVVSASYKQCGMQSIQLQMQALPLLLLQAMNGTMLASLHRRTYLVPSRWVRSTGMTQGLLSAIMVHVLTCLHLDPTSHLLVAHLAPFQQCLALLWLPLMSQGWLRCCLVATCQSNP